MTGLMKTKSSPSPDLAVGLQTKRRRGRSTWLAASPTPFASYINSNMWPMVLLKSASTRVTGLDLWRNVGWGKAIIFNSASTKFPGDPFLKVKTPGLKVGRWTKPHWICRTDFTPYLLWSELHVDHDSKCLATGFERTNEHNADTDTVPLEFDGDRPCMLRHSVMMLARPRLSAPAG